MLFDGAGFLIWDWIFCQPGPHKKIFRVVPGNIGMDQVDYWHPKIRFQ